MASPGVCDAVLPLFERHVAGTASADEGARLASHALGCPKCATAMRRVAEIAAERGPQVAPDHARPQASRAAAWRGRHPALVVLGALLVLVASAATLWYTALRPRPALLIVRGRGGDLRLMGTLEPEGTLRLAWPRSPGAAGYTVKLTGRSGTEVTRSVSEPLLVLQASEMATLGDMTVAVESESTSAERSSQTTSLVFPKLATR
jgi:hypothetical protein